MYKYSSFTIAAFIALVLLLTNRINAQVHFVPNTDTCHCFNTISAPQYPPVRSDMPFDVIISWIVLDSLCRTGSYVDVMNWATTTTHDSLLLALKYFYKLQDYDPLLLNQYSKDIRRIRHQNPPNTYYFGVRQIYEQRFGSISHGLQVLLNSDYIFHVRVVGQSSFLKYISAQRHNIEIFCADLQILDKLKGQTLYPTCTELPSSKRREYIDEVANCIRITWARELLEDAKDEKDSLIFQQWGPSHMEISKEYFVLLDHELQWENGDTTTWATTPYIYEHRNGEKYWSFPIIGGNVQDIKNALGLGNDIPISEYKNLVRSTIITFLGL